MFNLAVGVMELGYSCDLVLARAHGDFLTEVPAQLQVVDLGAARMLTSLPGLVRYLRRERPAALISAIGHANVLALLAVRLARVPTRVLVSEHATAGAEISSRFIGRAFPFLVRRFYPAAHAVIAVSTGVADSFSSETGFPRERIEVIYNPVITAALLASAGAALPELVPADGTPFILAAGRLTPVKDFALLITAFARMPRRHGFRLLILGEGEEREKLEQLAVSLGLRLGEDILLPGFVADPYPYMRHCSVFVLSSLSEGLPTVLIEALACGARVVSTDCPSGPREILQDGRLGTLVPVGDDRALADAIMIALEGEEVQLDCKDLDPYRQQVAAGNYLRVLAA